MIHLQDFRRQMSHPEEVWNVLAVLAAHPSVTVVRHEQLRRIHGVSSSPAPKSVVPPADHCLCIRSFRSCEESISHKSWLGKFSSPGCELFHMHGDANLAEENCTSQTSPTTLIALHASDQKSIRQAPMLHQVVKCRVLPYPPSSPIFSKLWAPYWSQSRP